jgi:hypothetical protein
MTDPAETFATLSIGELLTVLLKQMKRPLASVGVTIADDEAKRCVQSRIEGRWQEPPGLLQGLAAAIKESEAVLARWGLTFQQSLDTPMDKIPGWETTAEFLELANEKANAELRITLGAALTLALGGERGFVPYLEHLAAGEYGDETVIARRVLAFSNQQSAVSDQPKHNTDNEPPE